jgi:protoheme IX farnesyltransferase
MVVRVARGRSGLDLHPMRFFHWSNIYLALVFAAIAIDPLITG